MATATRTRKPARKASAAQVEARDARLTEAHERLTAGIADLVNGESWKAMLATAAKFHRYSLNNLMLIRSQRPDATEVRSYKQWIEQGRQVRDGEKGIRIFAPSKRLIEDKETGEKATRIVGFRLVSVFDISQTDGPEVVTSPTVRDFVTLLEGEAPEGAWDALAKIVAEQGYSLERVADASVIGGANGRTTWGARLVQVRADVSDAQACKTLTHEIAHILCGHEHRLDRTSRYEVEAESVAFLVGDAIGLNTSDYSFGYVAGWAGEGKVAEELTSTAKRVLEVARAVIAEIDGTEETAA